MINYNLIKSKSLIIILAISILGNLYLTTKLSNYENTRAIVRGNNYLNYFQVLHNYEKTLERLVNNDIKYSEDIDRELQALAAHSFNLVEHARTYAQLSNKEGELSDLVWNFAVALESNNSHLIKKIEKNREGIDEIARNISEIVKLEKEARLEMSQKANAFLDNEMYLLLSPKVKKTIELLDTK